jgi:hypothetical protein
MRTKTTKPSSPVPHPHQHTLKSVERSFELSLQATNKAPKTIRSYLESLHRLMGYLEREGLPATVEGIEKAHLDAFVADLLKTQKVCACQRSSDMSKRHHRSRESKITARILSIVIATLISTALATLLRTAIRTALRTAARTMQRTMARTAVEHTA